MLCERSLGRPAARSSVCDIAPGGQYYNVQPPAPGCSDCSAGTYKTEDATAPATSPAGSDEPTVFVIKDIAGQMVVIVLLV